jgi:hypothetical protein
VSILLFFTPYDESKPPTQTTSGVRGIPSAEVVSPTVRLPVTPVAARFVPAPVTFSTTPAPPPAGELRRAHVTYVLGVATTSGWLADYLAGYPWGLIGFVAAGTYTTIEVCRSVSSNTA